MLTHYAQGGRRDKAPSRSPPPVHLTYDVVEKSIPELLVGLRGTMGLSSRGGIIPLSLSQDISADRSPVP
jgi:hypothetical protein